MPQKTPLSETSSKTGEPKRSLFQSAVDFLFGYDFFISCAWKDARTYAVALSAKLRTQGFECFLDSTEYAKGDDWRRTGKRALRKTSKLLLLGSPAALDSEPVLHELEAFQSTNRIILPIDFGGSLRNPAGRSCPLLQKLSPDILSIAEPLERLEIGPSENTLKEIRDGFRIARQQQKRLRWFAGAAFGFAIIAAIAGWQWHEAGVARDTAVEQAQIADVRRLAAESSSALNKYPQRSLLLAVEAVKLEQQLHGVRVASAEQSLRDALAFTGGRTFEVSSSGTTDTVRISPDNRWVVTCGWDKKARLSDLGAKDLLISPVVLPGHGEDITSVGFSPDSHWLVTGCDDGTAVLWGLSAKGAAASPVVLDGDNYTVRVVAISPDNRWLVTGSYYGPPRLWDLTASSAKNPVASSVVLRGHEKAVSDGPAWLPELSAISKKKPAVTEKVFGDKKAVEEVGFSPDNHWLVTRSLDGTALLWDLRAKDPTASSVVLPVDENNITVVGFSADSRWLVTGSDDGVVRLWNLRAENPVASPIVLRGHKKAVRAVGFSPDNHWLVTGSDDSTAVLWDVSVDDHASGWVTLLGHEAEISAIGFSPDNHWLVTGGMDNKAQLWDLTALSAKNLAAGPVVLRGHEKAVVAVGFSPDNHWLVTGSNDRMARLWDLSAKNPAADPIVLPGHEGPVDAVWFSPDSRWLVTGSSDKTARLWDLSVKDLTASSVVLHGHNLAVDAVAISPDNRWLVTASMDGTARLWLLQVKDLIALARLTVGRNFSSDEWRHYFPDERYHKTFPDLPAPD
jgi:WD40 repeat protein